MPHEIIDTNVIIRYLVEDPESIDKKFKGVYNFFKKLETGEVKAYIPDLIIFQCYFVLTSYYQVPVDQVSDKLEKLVLFRGILMQDKKVICRCFQILQSDPIDIVDAYILAFSEENKLSSVYSFDSDLKKRGMKLLKVS